jgi:hypothetical protein
MQFQCPVCSCPEYQRVVVPRPQGAPYETEFFHCLGCSLMFTEPALFTEALVFRTQQDAKADAPDECGPNSGAPAAALDQQALRYRFWHAKAKRERGWWEPTSEEVLRVRDRYRQ